MMLKWVSFRHVLLVMNNILYPFNWNFSNLWVDDKLVDIQQVEAPILDAEPDLGAGVAGALRLAMSKGYLEKETTNRPSAARFSHLQAQNYSIEDKAHG